MHKTQRKCAYVLFDKSYDAYTEPSPLEDAKLVQTLWHLASVGVYYVAQ
jgi:hypothetical protein